jgi:site-specific recombinase XerD
MAGAGLKTVQESMGHRSIAGRLIMPGVNLKAVQILMGQKSITIKVRYSHLAAHRKRAAMELIVPS